MANDTTGTVGLVLSGGGAFGAYEIGVIRALCNAESPANSHTPFDPAVFAGTSVGSFNAAFMAMNKGGAQASANHLYNTWINEIADNGNGRGNGVYRIRGDIENYLDVRIPGTPVEQFKRMFQDTGAFGGFAARSAGRFLSEQGRLLNRLTGLVDMSVLLNTDPFHELLRTQIDPQALRDSPKSLTVTATNWGSGQPRGFNFRKMTDEQTWTALRASAAIPALFPAVTMEGETFIDGCVVMNTPIKPAIDKGATELHVISLDPSVRDLSGKYIGTTWDVLNRVYTAAAANNISEDIESAKWINQGLEILDRVDAGEEFDSGDGQRFVRAAMLIGKRLRTDGALPKKLTIHRYYPPKALGGLPGMLNFERSVIDGMIAQGQTDARAHDCRANGCLLSERAKKVQAAAG